MSRHSLRRLRRLGNIFIVSLLTFCLTFSASPKIASAGQNPSPEEIARIFDEVALEKQVPAEILKAIAYTESGWRQWDSKGNLVANYAGKRPYLGIMQVGTYDPADKATIDRLKNDIAFNIEYGADVLLSKWEMTPRIGDGDKSKLENWYFAIWAYNTWSTRNNPNNAAASGRTAYQDKILNMINSGYYGGFVEPVKITPFPKSLIPAGTVPSKKAAWKTPEPVHYAAFKDAVPALSSAEQALLAPVKRIAGTDRIDTAVKIAQEGWPNGCQTVIIAKSGDFPDALAGVALAKQNNAPILLTTPGSLDPKVEDALLELKPLKVIILGGEEAVSTKVENELKELITWTEDFTRIFGENRYDTAAQIASEFPEGTGAAIATGHNFPDALSLAPAAAAQGYPLLLVAENSLPEATADVLRKLKPGSLYIAGGEGAVSAGVLEEIMQITGLTEDQITRFAGENRYETSTQILRKFYPETRKIFLATGQNFPDALAGSALAANQNIPMLLVPPGGTAVSLGTKDYLNSLPEKPQIEVFGGQSAVPDRIILQLIQLMQTQAI